jgi:hypothetical protein
MATLQIIGKVVRTTGIWALLWGLTGAAVGAVMTLIDPDTGHIPRTMVLLMIGVPSAVFGALAGLLFALVVVPAAFASHSAPPEGLYWVPLSVESLASSS